MSYPMQLQQMLFMVKAFLPLIGQAAMVEQLKIETQSDTEHCIQLGNSGIFIDTGYAVKSRGITGTVSLEGFRVWTMEVQGGGRYSPPEDVDITRCETNVTADVLVEVATLLASEALNRLPSLPPELAPEDPVLEQAW